MRDLENRPYSPDEVRVATFFFERGIGGGDDPIGFLMASYSYIMAEWNELRNDGSSACEKPEGWDEIASANSRALEEMMALPRDGSETQYRVTAIDLARREK